MEFVAFVIALALLEFAFILPIFLTAALWLFIFSKGL